MNKKIESLSGKIDTVLVNEQIIKDCLKTNELLFNQTLRSETPVSTADSVHGFTCPMQMKSHSTQMRILQSCY
jgi:hypothetical protein